MDEVAHNQDELVSEPPAAAEEAPAGVEDLPAEAPAPADIDAQPVFAGKAITEPDTPADVLQQDAQPAESTVTEPQIPAAAGEPPAAQPEPAAADSQKIWIDTSQDDARTLPESSPGPAAAAGDLAVQQAGAGPARQQTGAGRQKKGVVLIKVGTQWVEQKKLRQSEVEALAERLSKSRPLPPPEKRARAVRLTYAHDVKARKYLPKLVPAKTTTKEEQTEYMVGLAARCAESEEKKQRMLEAKYLQPLAKPKRIRKKSMEAHIAKMDKLYQGQPTG